LVWVEPKLKRVQTKMWVGFVEVIGLNGLPIPMNTL